MVLHKTVSQLLREISSRELAEWMAFDMISPIGEIREDWRVAMLASTYANCHRDPKKSAFKPEDFLLFQQKEENTDPLAASKKIAASFGVDVDF